MNSTVNINGSAGGVQVNGNFVRSGNTVEAHDPTLAVGKSGTLGTRTDNDTGVVTLSTGHGIASLDVCDVYWTGGKRLGMAATVSTNDVTLDGGTGDNLPAEDSTVIVCKQQEVSNVSFDGTAMTQILIGCTQRCTIQFLDSGDTVLLAAEIASAGEAYIWNSGSTTPINGTVAKVLASNGSTASAVLSFFVILP